MVLDNLRENLLAIVFIGIVVAAGAIGITSLQDSLGDNACTISNTTWNASGNSCYDSAGNDLGNLTTAANITIDSLAGTDNASGFMPTIGTLLGVAALIAVVVGGFIFLRR